MKRPSIHVTRDEDGGLTLSDPASGVVLSVISTNPAASGPIGLYVEAYAYRGGPIAWQEATTRTGIARHPTFAFYVMPEGSLGE
jgi:hypothetical protein